jgi:DNA invertase Pin-like site-specific DNA recombinase
MRDLQNVSHDLRERGISLIVTEQSINTSTVEGRAFFNMLGVFAEFETDLRRERQREGIDKAMAKGVYKGRKAVHSKKSNAVRTLLEQGMSKVNVAKELGMSRQTVYRIIKEMENEK